MLALDIFLDISTTIHHRSVIQDGSLLLSVVVYMRGERI